MTPTLKKYRADNFQKTVFLIALICIIIVLGFISITTGPLDIKAIDAFRVIINKVAPGMCSELPEYITRTVWLLRLPRYLTAVLVGFTLAIAGAIMQPVLRNPLASPFTLGISAGAGFGASLVLILGAGIFSGRYSIVLNAFIFAALSAFIIILISRRKNTSPEIMILTGIAISYFFTSCTTVLQVFAEPWAVTEVVFWLVGSLAKGTWENLGYMFPVIAVCIPYLMFKSWDLDIIGTGDDAAKSMGIEVERTRVSLMIVSSLVTAAVVCFTGTIGFIGLVAPHIARMIIGNDNKFVIPTAGLTGAFLLVISDLVAVNIVSPVILPIGVVTSFMGVPLFVYLILKRRGLAQ